MALSKASNTYNRPTWEDSNFPILCQVCLGDNPYVRMMKDKFGSECKICKRPFTIFKWCPGRGMRYKKTEICQTCCKLKNVCQTCLLDLEYGLPVQVRDQALQVKETMPKNQVNREFYLQNVEKELSQGDGTEPAGELGNIARTSDLLNKLARKTPYYRRNLPHICSFWVKGECKRGEECPYRHEKPTDPDDPLADQNIKDRYFGVNDPVADKIMTRVKAMPQLSLPEDLSVTTLYVGNLGSELGDASVEEKDLRDYFYQFGEVRNITILSSKGCAFVQFTTRRAAELAAERSYNKLIVKGRRLTVRWGRPQSVARGQEGVDSFGRPLAPVPGLPGPLPTPMDFFGLSQQQDVSATKPSQADSAPEAEKQGEESESADVAGPSSKKARAETSSDGGAKPPNPPAPQPPPIRGWPPMPFPMPPGFPPFPVGGYNFARPPLPFSGPPNSAPPVHGFHAPKAIHYPSQDPLHLGARDVQE